MARQRFHPCCSGAGATEDADTADLLLAEFAEQDPFGFLTSTAQMDLRARARELVGLHCRTIEAIARELCKSQPVELDLSDPVAGWSTWCLDIFRRESSEYSESRP
jgi:hypothetical protein